MRLSQRHKLEPTVATHFPSLAHDVDQNVYMFVQDVQLAVMPIGGKSTKHKGFAIKLEGKQCECEKAEQLIAEIGNFDRPNIERIVSDAVEEVMRHLACEGCAVYEIIRDDDGVHHIWSFTSRRLWRLLGYFLQIIPRRDWNLWNKKFVIVPADRIWHIDMPSELGGQREYKKVLRRLGKFESIGPKFWRQNLKGGVQSKNFDFQRYVRNAEVYHRQVTKTWGWNLRDSSTKWTTEFFNCYKMIDYFWAKTILREHVINELNRFFIRLGIECEITVIGLPTVQEIKKVRSELLEGRISFGDVLDWVWL